jgi:hypothetical protein
MAGGTARTSPKAVLGQFREMENICGGPTLGDFVTILTEESMQEITVARPESKRVQTTLPHSIKCNVLRESLSHKVLIYKEHHSVFPLVRIGTPPTPLPLASVPLPPGPKGGGGHTRLRLRGWGSPNSDDWKKSLALWLLCGLSDDSQIFLAQH